MRRRLPARPNLEHLRNQAKALLAKLREGDREAVRTLSEYLPEAANLSPKELREHGFRLADAQAAIARKSGFAAWPGLARHVDRLRSLEGTWSFHSLEVDGAAMPASMLTNSSLLIDGDRFRMESPEATYDGIFTIDVEQMPHHINIDFVEGPEAGNRCEGLFELEGDRFRLCLGLVGSQRPEGFTTSSGSGHALEDLRRKQRARPPAVDGGRPPTRTVKPVSVTSVNNFESHMTPTLRRLQGDWSCMELVTSGTSMQASWLPFGSRTQSGGETKVVFGGQTQLHAKIRFNESTSPMEVDYYNLAGKAKGSISLGLFRWDGDDCVFCISPPGAPRPSGFNCAAGSGRTLSRWKRKS